MKDIYHNFEFKKPSLNINQELKNLDQNDVHNDNDDDFF